jgi:hypothetical protein
LYHYLVKYTPQRSVGEHLTDDPTANPPAWSETQRKCHAYLVSRVPNNTISNQNFSKIFTVTSAAVNRTNALELGVGIRYLRVLREYFVDLQLHLILGITFVVNDGTQARNDENGVAVNTNEGDQSSYDEHDRSHTYQHTAHPVYVSIHKMPAN